MRIVYAFLLLIYFFNEASAAPVRIKDLANIDGVRGNDLIGYGLVVGLSGSGDSLKNSPFTEEIMTGLLERLGVNITDESFRPQNVAAVIITATLPPFARTGSQIDINVAAIGDSKSLLGGTLVMTPLNAADGETYAIAQGSILASGAEASGVAAAVVQGVPTTGTIPSGARVEREVFFDFSKMKNLRLALRNPDFTTATRVEAAINHKLGRDLAEILDSGTIGIDLATLGKVNLAKLVAKIENITVEPDLSARVIIDHKSGTIVIGEYVRISPVAVSQGNLTLRVRETPIPSQPNPFSPGKTVLISRTQAEIAHEPGIGFAGVSGESSLLDVVSGLNALGIRPRDMIDILKSVHTAGALHAELIVD